MPDKRRKLSSFDLPAAGRSSAAGTNVADDLVAGVAITTSAPQNVVLTSDVVYASAAPQSYIQITWSPPDTNTGQTPDRYTIQVSTNSSFTASGTITTAIAPANRDAPSARVDGLPPNTLHYVRLRAIVSGYPGAWSSMSPLTTGVNRITTAQDTTPAGVPTSVSATWIGVGDLLVTWTNPSEGNLRDVEIKIRASSGGTIYRTIYSVVGRFLYTLAMNLQDTSGAGDSSLYVELRSRTFSSVFGTTVNTGLVTKAAPATPAGLTQTWSGDTGTAGAGLSFAWTRSDEAARYRLTLDGVARQLSGAADTYTYSFALNKSEHAGTADPAISYSLVALDGFGQASSASSGTATNAAPAAPSSVGISGYFSSFAIAITATPPADFDYYLVRIIQASPSAADVTFRTRSTLIQRGVSAAATYQVGVKVVDVFGSQSSETLSSTSTIDSLTLSDLRSRIVYSDSESSTAATLKAALADDNKTSGGISYASNAGWVRSIRADWNLQERIKTITLSMTPSSGTTSWYLRTSTDGSTWSYWSGPVTSSRILTSVVDASAAQAAAVSAATLGGSTTSRVDLPALTEIRYVELWLRNTSASTRVDEFYPRRLVQSDDIEAESIRAINIAAGSITADRLSVSQLSAITADMGSITAGTITGATIRSAASGARWEGNSTHLFGTNGTTTQWEVLNSSGKLTAGGGNLILDESGLTTYIADSGILSAVRWTASGDSGNVGQIWALRSSSGAAFDDFRIERRRRDGTNLSQIQLSEDRIALYPDVSLGGMDVLDTSTDVYSQVTVTVTDAGTTNVPVLLALAHNSTATTAAGFGGDLYFNLRSSTTDDTNAALIRAEWTAVGGSRQGRLTFYAFDTAARQCIRIQASGSAAQVGFLGATPTTRPAVSGSRAGNAALASALSALATLGLITDSSTA